MDRIIIGIDISKKKFDVAYETSQQKWKQSTFDNTIKGFEVFIKWIQETKAVFVHIVLEATGRYGEGLANFMYLAGHQVSVINPAQIKNYSRSLLKRAKTDKVDAQLITEFAQRHELRIWQPLSPSFQALKDQVRCLESFKKDATQISNRLGQTVDPIVRQMLEERLSYIRKQIEKLLLILKQLVEQDNLLRELAGLLVTIPGIGDTSALNLLAELPDLETFKCAKQLAAYAGLNPSIRTSGTSVKGRGSLSRIGHKELRKILYLPALSLMGRQTALSPFIERLKERGKKGMVIVCAVMHKLLHIIFGVLKKRLAFQP